MKELIERDAAIAAMNKVGLRFGITGMPQAFVLAEKAIRALPAIDMAVKVKPLVWEEPCVRNNQTHIARSIFGDYYVHIDGGRHQAWLEAHTKPYENPIGEVVGCLYTAQALAQADYEQRILAALDVTPALSPIPVDDKITPDPVANAARDTELLLDAYKGILVLHRMLDRVGLTKGADAANSLAGRIVEAHPEFPGLSSLRAIAEGQK